MEVGDVEMALGLSRPWWLHTKVSPSCWKLHPVPQLGGKVAPSSPRGWGHTLGHPQLLGGKGKRERGRG